MKIIQSYWSLPNQTNDLDINGRSKGGFIDIRFNYMSWALSCLSLKKFYKNVELITDKQGENLLIDTLKLPYTNVSVELDGLNHYHSKLWAIGKIKAYQMQTAPFLHVDGDVFIWKPLGDKEFLNNKLVVQNIERSYEYYAEILNSLTANFDYMPQTVKNNYAELKDYTSVNAGIIGGNDVDFFQLYTNEAFNFVDKNADKLDSINTGLFNCVYEQYLFYCLTKEQNIDITPLLQLEPKKEFSELMCFNLVPFEKSYVHLIGFAKSSIYACEQVEMRLKYEHPQYHKLIDNLFKDAYFPKRQARFKKLKKIYDFMSTATIDSFLAQPFQLNPHVHCSEETNILTYTPPQFCKKTKTPVEGWDALLNVFQEPICGNDIMEVLSDNNEVTDVSKLKRMVVSYLSEHLIYTDILDFAKSA
jgi:hypothetical protein